MNAGYVYKSGKWVWQQSPKKDTTSRQKYAAYQANPTHYMIDDSYAQARKATEVETAARIKAQAAARARAAAKAAEAQQRKHNGILGSIKSGLSSAWHGAVSGTKAAGDWIDDNWNGIKTGLTVVGFGACVIASAGACLAVSVGIASVKFIGDGALEGEWDVRAYAKDVAWSAVSAAGAATFARAFGGAATWREAYGANAFVRGLSVRVACLCAWLAQPTPFGMRSSDKVSAWTGGPPTETCRSMLVSIPDSAAQAVRAWAHTSEFTDAD
jgi:hypothetical protein